MKVISTLVIALALSGLAIQADLVENTFDVQNQWGGSNAPWHLGGRWVIGDRSTKRAITVDASSSDNGRSLVGTMQYQGEGSIGFRATLISGNSWQVENQWGGSSAPWNKAGIWTIGGRLNKPVIKLQISSSDNGITYSGIMAYKGEGPIGFKARNINAYVVQNQWGGSSAPWHQGGTWIIGSRLTKRVIKVSATSSDNGNSLSGTMQYQGEGPIGFKAIRTSGNSWNVQNQWGGNSAPWNPAGTWIIGGRPTQPVVSLKIESRDNGVSFSGNMAYKGEGLIGFRA